MLSKPRVLVRYEKDGAVRAIGVPITFTRLASKRGIALRVWRPSRRPRKVWLRDFNADQKNLMFSVCYLGCDKDSLDDYVSQLTRFVEKHLGHVTQVDIFQY